MYQNLRKVQRRWGIIARVLAKIVATGPAWGLMYKAVAQLVLLYLSERWLVTGYMLKVLARFCHRSIR